MENYDAVLEFFKNATEPVSAGQVADGTGIDRKQVDKIMNKMKKEGTIVSPKRCYWEIKK